MKKLMTGILLLILACLGLTACSQETEESGGYSVYYINETEDQLTEQEYAPQATGGEALIQELLDCMRNPTVVTVKSAIPTQIEISAMQLQDGHLTLDFNSAYKELDNVTEVLLRAAVVQTLIQVPEVEDVRFTAGGEMLYDISGTEIGTMNEETFIDAKGEGINSYQYAALTLYFSDASGEKLVREMRNVHYSSNNSLEKVVVEQLLSGPVNTKLSPVLNGNAKILETSIQGNTCILNFDEAFNQAPANSPATPQTSIYALVNSICDVCDVSKVEIQIEGSTQEVYRDEVGLDQQFRRRAELIEPVTETETESDTQTQEEVVDPAVGVESLINSGTDSSETSQSETEAGNTQSSETSASETGVESES